MKKQKNNAPMFYTYAMEWMETKKMEVRASTWEGISIYVEKHIVPYFVETYPLLSVSDLRACHIHQYLLYKRTNGRMDSKPGGLSQASLKKHKSILHQICDEAVIAGFLESNPVSSVRLSKRDEDGDNRTFLSLDEANTILKLFRNHPLHGVVFLTLIYGLRRSEVLGLQWDAVDFERNTIRIKHTVVKNLTIHYEDCTKTTASAGTYEMLPEVRRFLLDLKTEEAMNCRLFGEDYLENNYIFKQKNGMPFRPDYVTRAFGRVVAKAGLGHITFHALRHSTASILYDKGWEVKDIQTWMRHKQVSTTLQLYVHISKMRKHIIGNDLKDCFKL